MNYLVFDIGGTNLRVAFFMDNKLVKEKRYKTINGSGLLDLLVDCVIDFKNEFGVRQFDGIGVSAPGFLESDKLKLTAPTNLNKVKNLSLKPLKKFAKKVVLENDANCAALGAFSLEKKKNKKVENLVCFTLGTGFGCGLILNGNLYRGQGVASEFGHTSINFNSEQKENFSFNSDSPNSKQTSFKSNEFGDGTRDSCGNNGCLESYVSIRGLNNLIKKNGLKVNAFELRELAARGDKKAFKIYKGFANFLSVGLVNITNTLDPEVIYLTGGLTNASRFFVGVACKEARKKFFRGMNPKIKVNTKNLSLIGVLDLIR